MELCGKVWLGMDAIKLQRIIAVLVARCGTGVCRITPHELAAAPVKQLRISTDKGGDVWCDCKNHASLDEDTWPVDD